MTKDSMYCDIFLLKPLSKDGSYLCFNHSIALTVIDVLNVIQEVVANR